MTFFWFAIDDKKDTFCFGMAIFVAVDDYSLELYLGNLSR